MCTHAHTCTLFRPESLYIFINCWLYPHNGDKKSGSVSPLRCVGQMVSCEPSAKMKSYKNGRHPTDNHHFIICYLITLHLALHVQKTKESWTLELGFQWLVLTWPKLKEYSRMQACFSQEGWLSSSSNVCKCRAEFHPAFKLEPRSSINKA